MTIAFRSVSYEVKAMQILSSNGKLKVLNRKFSSAFKEDEVSVDLFENDYYESDMAIVKLNSEVPGVNPVELSTIELKKDGEFLLMLFTSQLFVYELSYLQTKFTRQQ